MALDANQVVPPTRPLQQTDSWTFTSALALLKSAPEQAASDALDEFLTSNKDVVLSPVPFLTSRKDTTNRKVGLDASKKEFTLRGVLYSGVTEKSVKRAQKLASFLAMDEQEALRIVLQTDKRSPEPVVGENSISRLLLGSPAGNSVVPGSKDSPDNERLLFYAKRALKERRSVVRVAAECFNVRNIEAASSVVRNLGRSLVVLPEYSLEAVAGLEALIHLVSKSASIPEFLEGLLRDELISHVTQLLQLVFDIILASPEISPEFASSWFKLMKKTSFGLSLASHVNNHDSFSVLHGLITIITLQIFDLPSLSPAHLSNPSLFSEITSLVLRQSPNNIVAYAWLIRLYKTSILLEEFPSAHESFLSIVPLKNTQNDLSVLQGSLQNVPVFSEIVQLNKILSFDNVFAVVLTDLILAAIPLIHPTDEIILCISEVLRSAPETSVEKFFDDEEARQLIVLARAKFPASLSPYLKLAAINGNFALHEFEELASYMAIFNKSDFESLYDVDSENTDLVRLTKPVDVFPPFEPAGKLSLLLKVGTKAKIIATADKEKILVTFLHKYNGWAFLGRVMENITKSFDNSDVEKLTALESILDLLIQTTAQDPDNAPLVLEYMSKYVDDSDIVDVIFRVFEQSMHIRSIVLSEKVLILLSSLMPVISARLWSYLSTSSLLPNRGKEGFVSILFGTIETVQGDYRFTNALVKFVFCLADNCLSVTKDHSEDSKSIILAKLIKHIIQVFENYGTCKFNDSFHKFELGILILDVFTQTLDTIYSVGPNAKIEDKPTRVFAKASQNIVEAFLAPSTGFARSYSSLIDLIDSLASPAVSFESHDVSGFLGNVWVHSALSFARHLVTIRSATDLQPSTFEESLFSRLPQLVTIYSFGGSLRKIILDLLTALTGGKWEAGKMPSILSHLGQDHSHILLHALATDLESSFDDYSIKIAVYDFLCSIMEANQQGLSVLFISGRNVFGEMSEEKDTKAKEPTLSLLSILKKNINDFKSDPPTVTVHLLDAISLAFNSWTTARSDNSDVVFVRELITMFENYNKALDTKSATELILSSYYCKAYAKVAEILSLVLFTTKNEECVEAIQGLLLSSTFIEKLPSLFAPLDYEIDLYENVKKQFHSVFESHHLSDFAVSMKKRNRFGFSMVYDLLLLDSYFQKNPKWPEIREQIVFLSANMQYYHTQISLSKATGALLATFCRRSPTHIPKEYSGIVHELLAIKEPRDVYSAQFCAHQYYERVELAFLLAFTINNNKDGATAIAPSAVSLIEACNDLLGGLDMANKNRDTKGVSHRSLLRIVFIALASLKTNFEAVSTRTQALSKAFELVIAKGSTDFIIQLQNDVYLSRTNKSHEGVDCGERLEDLNLVLSVLKEFVQLQITNSLEADLSALLAKHKTVETLLSLYSFSHLILVNNDPVFAQLSLMFLQQLLEVESFAEKIVDSKMFMVIRESMISQVLRDGGVSVFNATQVHGTWTNGILPILVTCLSRGKAISECIFTLRAFSRQIEFSIEAWSSDSSSLRVSSAGTFETMQVVYIFQILMSIATAQGVSVKEPTDVDMPILPGLDTQQKRDDFVGFVGNLLKHPKFLKSRVYPSSPEEEALVKTDGVEFETFVKRLIEDIKELRELLV
ncbi:hypothetical protein OXX59_006429 [Metschnikowia pulcherrima]